MKKRNSLQALGALTLLPVLAVFLSACEMTGGFHPLLRGIRLYSDSYDAENPDQNLLDDDHPFVIDSASGKYLVIVCDKPSSISDNDISIALSLDKSYLTIPFIYGDTINGKSTIGINVKPFATGTSTITVTAEPGGVTASCTVNTSVPPTPSYGITLSQTGTYGFNDAIAGYSALTPLTVTVTSTSNQATGNLTAKLTGANLSSFTLTGASITSITASGGTATFTVAPNTGLAAGTYNATVTVSGSNNISAQFNVSFTVNAPITYTVTFDKNGGTTDASPATKDVTTPATTVGTLPAQPTRSGYRFNSWNTQSDGLGTAFTATTTVTASITVYAQWDEKSAGATITNFDPKFKTISPSGFTIYNATTPTLSSATGQTIEYAYNTTGTASPTSAWQDASSFSSLSLSNTTTTTYTIFARAKENDDYKAGTASTKNMTIFSGTLPLLTALGVDCEYDGSTKIVMASGSTATLSSSVTIPTDIGLEIKGDLTIPSTVNLEINGTVNITDANAKFRLNGTMFIKNGGTFEIADLKSPPSSSATFKVEDVLYGSGNVTVEGTFVFPTTGTIRDTLSNITSTITIKGDGQLSLNRLEDGTPGSSAIDGFNSANPYNFIGKINSNSDFEFAAGSSFIIDCSTGPVFKIPSGSTVTVAAKAASALSLNTVPLNTDLTVDATGELEIAAGKELFVFTPTYDNSNPDSTHKTTLVNNGTIWLAGTNSRLRVTRINIPTDFQFPGIFTTGTTAVYKGTSGTTSAAYSQDTEYDIWSY
jgi:uncharacterized repeat protein (TIGR02543 family)